MKAQAKEIPIILTDNKSALKDPAKFMTVSLALQCVVESYRQSLFSFEWLNGDGEVRTQSELEDTQKSKYDSVYAAYKTGIALERPVLGIGIGDNIEIGSRRDVLLTLYSLGVRKLDVHVPKSCADDFAQFMC